MKITKKNSIFKLLNSPYFFPSVEFWCWHIINAFFIFWSSIEYLRQSLKQQVHFIVDCLQTFDLDPRAFSTKSVAVIILGNGYED